MKLEKGKYYVYYNPSYLNGYENLIDKGLDMHHLQALESICWDELVPDLEYLESDQFLNDLIQNNEGLFTKRFMDKHFDHSFKRTFDVEFLLNPDFKGRYLDPNPSLP